jgi:hypothetical protein
VLTKILSALEEQSGRSVLQLFDWMGGTSTGQSLVDPELCHPDPDPDPNLLSNSEWERKVNKTNDKF